MTNRLFEDEFLRQVQACYADIGLYLPALIEKHTLAVVVGALGKEASDRLVACQAGYLCTDEEAMAAVDRMSSTALGHTPQ